SCPARGREEQTPRFLCSLRSVPIACVGGHYASRHQHLPLSRESVGIAHARFLCQLLHECPDRIEVPHRGDSHPVPAVAVLEQRPYEGASLEIRPTEPLVEHVEHDKQLRTCCPAPALSLPLHPGPRPQLFAPAKKRQRELVLRGIVL